ncbi:MAG: hypothetical protein Q9163_005758 [Psora crenata]
MHKCPSLRAALGKRSPVTGSKCLRSYPRCLHSTPYTSKDAGQDRVIHGRDSASPPGHLLPALTACKIGIANPRPNRAKRLEAASNEIQTLYQRSAAKDPSNNNIPLSSSDEPISYNATTFGSPLNKEVLERQKSPRLRPRVDVGPSAASQPSSTSPQPIDARNLGAEAPTFSIRYTDQDGDSVTPQAAERATAPASIKERLRQRAEARRDGTSSSLAPNRLSTKEAQFRGQRPRESRPLRGKDHGDRGKGERGSRARGSNVDPVPRSRRGRDGGDATSASSNLHGRRMGIKRDPEKDVEEEFAYCEETFKEALEKPLRMGTEEDELYRTMIALKYEPPDEKGLEEGLAGSRPAFVSSWNDISEIMAEQISLASRVLEGEFVQWASKEQRADVLALVERLKHADPSLVKGKLDRPTSKPEDAQRQVSALVQKLLAGQYALARPKAPQDVLGTVQMQLDRNQSYFPPDSKALVQEISAVMVGKYAQNRGPVTPTPAQAQKQPGKDKKVVSGKRKGAKT